MLLWHQLQQVQTLPGSQRRQRSLSLPFLSLVEPLLVHLQEPREQALAPLGAKEVRQRLGAVPCPGRDIGRRHLVHRRLHLAGDKAAPDQLVQSGLLVVQEGAQLLGRPLGPRGPDRLVRLLGRLDAGPVGRRLRRQVRLAPVAGNHLPCRLLCFRRHVRRIRAHVRDQPDRALLPDRHPLVQLLRHPHGQQRRIAERLRGRLLHRARGKGSRRRTRPLRRLHPVDPVGRPLERIHDRLRIFPVLQVRLLCRPRLVIDPP